MEDRNTTINTNFSNSNDIELTPININELTNKYEDKIKKIMITLKEEGKEDFDRKILKDLMDLDLFLDEELVNRTHNTYKLNLHLANILKDNNFRFSEIENN